MLAFTLPEASSPGKLPTEFRVFPKGTFKTVQGTFHFTEASAASVLEAAREWGNAFSMDYEHRALKAANSGEGVAPAAAWLSLEVRDGELWAVNVEWTERAKAYLSAREYRYFSPAFHTDKDGAVTRLLNIALTNVPAMHELTPLAASAATLSPAAQETPPMKTVLQALKLADTATEAEALSAINRTQEGMLQLLSLTGKTSAGDALATVQGWKVGFEEAAKLSQEVKALSAKVQAAEVDALIAKGKADNKVTPRNEAFCRKLAEKDVTLLSAFLEAAQPAIKEPHREARTSGGGEVPEELRAIAAHLGHKAEDVAKLAQERGLDLNAAR